MERTKQPPSSIASSLPWARSSRAGKAARTWSSLARARALGSRPASPCRLACLPTIRLAASLPAGISSVFRRALWPGPGPVAQRTQGALISLDDKTVHASCARATAASPFQLLSAWCAAHGGLVMGHSTTETKSQERTALPELCPLLAIQGCLVTDRSQGLPEGQRWSPPGPSRRRPLSLAEQSHKGRQGEHTVLPCARRTSPLLAPQRAWLCGLR